MVTVGPTVEVLVLVGAGDGTQKMPVYTEFDNDGGDGSSESMPAVFVIVCPHVPVTWPLHETDCTPPQVLPTVQFTTFPGFEQDVPPLQPIYVMPFGTVSNNLGFVDAVRLKTFKLSYFCGPSFAW